MAKTNLTKVESYTTVDSQTGEILSQVERKNYQIRSEEPPYIKLYFEQIAKLSGISNTPVLASLLTYIDYEGVVIVNRTRKERISKQLSCSVPTIDRVLNEMVSSGISTRKNRGEYLINPRIFGKGSWVNIAKAIERYEEITIKVKINNNGAEVSTEI